MIPRMMQIISLTICQLIFDLLFAIDFGCSLMIGLVSVSVGGSQELSFTYSILAGQVVGHFSSYSVDSLLPAYGSSYIVSRELD